MKIGLVEGGSLSGRELRRLLGASSLRKARVVVLEPGAAHERPSDTEDAEVESLGALSLAGSDLVFLCGESGLDPAALEQLAREDVPVVAMGSGQGAPLGWPRVVVGVNDDPMPASSRVVSPHPATVVVATLVGAFGAYEPLGGRAVVMLPAAHKGRAGLEELHRQAVGILNFTKVPQERFERQLVFNLYPSSGELEPLVGAELVEVLGAEAPPLGVTLLNAPVFMGLTLLLELELTEDPSAAAVTATLERAHRVELAREGSCPGPGELSEEDAQSLVVAPLGSGGGRLRLWAVADFESRARARNALDLAERLLAERADA